MLTKDREMLGGNYKGKLQARYEQPQHSVVAQVFRGLAGKKVVTPSKDFVRYVQGGKYCSQLHSYDLCNKILISPATTNNPA